jgi:hypothetical protein
MTHFEGSGVTNCPRANGSLFWCGEPGGTYVFQLFFYEYTDATLIWWRAKSTGSWRSWVSLA